MNRITGIVALGATLVANAMAFGETAVARPAGRGEAKSVVYVIPIRDEIAKPVLYILRRGLKEAIEQKADAVVLDMQTPGGALDVTFEIMEALGNFPGEKITFVNKEALSAGAFISAATDEIYFTPDGVIGAAAPVLATGGELDASMKQKIISYLRAKVRAESEGKGYRGEVISAMIDAELELKIGDKIYKPKGELLSLTATEANESVGDPPRRLLGAGIAKDVNGLLEAKFGKEGFEIRRLEITWSEKLAQYLNGFAAVLMGLGLLALFIEFKTPGFGVFGVTGITLLLLVFFGHYVAGLSGHEPALLFFLGVVLVLAELLFFPGTVVSALIGVMFVFGSLIWAGADLWPNQPVNVSGAVFVQPVVNLAIALAMAVALFVVLARYLPRTGLWQHLALQGASLVPAQLTGMSVAAASSLSALVGREGVAVTGMFPSGEVEIDGNRYQARVELGSVEANAPVIVTGHTDFELKVRKGSPS